MDNKALADFIRLEISRLSATINKLVHLLNTPGKQNPTSIASEGAAEDEGDRAPGTTSVVAPRPANPDKTKKSRRYAAPRRTLKWKAWRWTRRIFLKKDRLERVGICFGVAYAIVTIIQWRDLRQNFKIDQRAWVSIGFALPATITPNASVVVEAKNVGKSPAVRSAGDYLFQVIDSDSAPSFVVVAHHNSARVGLLFRPKARV